MKNKFLKKFLLGILIIILFLCIGLTNGKNRNVSVVEGILSGIITIPQKGFKYIENWFDGNELFFSDIEKLKEENHALKSKNEELKNKMIDYEILAAENKTLKEQARIRESYKDYEVVIADVISDSASNWDEIYIINKGSRDGIKPNMTVITTDGLVGYIETVAEKTSKIVSILDAGNSVSARSTRTRDSVIAKGNIALKDEGKLKITSIPIGVEFIEEDKFETSGMGGIYPKGIAIGEIESFENKANPLENEAILKTYVDFNKLETVAVIISDEIVQSELLS
ncbi:MAG: rod shape-determining protein MreC [Clostridia bacterium]|nr:rod shape-determining protein MreC [Clostridia bacterium]